MRGKYDIKIVKGIQSFGRLKDDWEYVFHQTEYKYPFLSFDWCFRWWNSCRGNRSLYIVVVYEDGRCIGIAPLCIRPQGPFRTLEFLVSERSDYLDFIVAEKKRFLVLELAIGYLKARQQDWDALILQNLFWEEDKKKQFESVIGHHGLLCRKRHYTEAPFIAIQSSWNDYLTGMGKRKKIRKKEKRLLNKADIDIVSVSRFFPEDPRFKHKSIFETAKQIEKHSWKYLEGNPRLQTDKNTEMFFQSVLKDFSEKGCLESWFLFVDGTPRAYAFNFQSKNKIFAYNSGYYNEYKEYGFGALLAINRLRDAFDKGRVEYDFLRGNEEYKSEWTKTSRPIHEYAVFNSRPVSRRVIQKIVQLKWALATSSRMKQIRYDIKCRVNRLRRKN